MSIKQLCTGLLALAMWTLTTASSEAAESTGTVISANFSPASITGAIIPNPDRGWAEWSGSDFVNNYDAGSVSGAKANGYRLVMCRLGLSSYRTSNLPAVGYLDTLQTRFAQIRAAGMKCVVWVAYDNFSGAADTTSAWMLTHIDQLGPIFKANADVIPYIKAGFIGNWGEWYGSTNGLSLPGTPDATAQAQIRDRLVSKTHPYQIIQFRYPSIVQNWFPSVLSSTQAFTGSKQSRVGFHNDCMLSGPSAEDTGSWKQETAYGSYTTAQMKAYMDAMTAYTPYGGEVSNNCQAPQRTTCADARADWARWHITWNKGPGSSSMSNWTSAWTSGGCTTELANRMGYWLQLDSVSHQATAINGQSITVRVKLSNLGYSRLFSPRRLVAKACLVASPYTCYEGKAPTDLRRLPSQGASSTRVAANIAIPVGAAAGAYQIRLSVPDIWPTTAASRDYAIRFGNVDSGGQVWNNTTGYMTTGTTLTVN